MVGTVQIIVSRKTNRKGGGRQGGQTNLPSHSFPSLSFSRSSPLSKRLTQASIKLLISLLACSKLSQGTRKHVKAE